MLGAKGTSGWGHPRTLAQGAAEGLEGAGPRWYMMTHSPREEHFNQRTRTLDVQAVAERGVARGIRGRAGVEAGVRHLGLNQPEGPRREDAVP